MLYQSEDSQVSSGLIVIGLGAYRSPQIYVGYWNLEMVHRTFIQCSTTFIRHVRIMKLVQ